MSKKIEEMTYTQILNAVERRPLWAVDKILKLSERVATLEKNLTELSARIHNLYENDDFMSDHG